MIAARTVTDTTVEVNGCSVDEWRSYAARFRDYNVYQTCAFAQQRAEEMNAECERVLVRRGSVIIGMAQVRIKRLPLMNMGVAYVFRGPSWRRDSASPDDFRAVVAAMGEAYSACRGLEVRIAPGMTDLTDSVSHAAALEAAGFSPRAGQSLERTILLDLTPEPDALRQGLAQKWRNGLNQALRHDVTVETRTDDEAMATFQALYDEMWADKRFETGVRVSSFRQVQAALHADEKLAVSLASHGGAAIAGHVSSCLGDTCIYLLGASTRDGRDRKASYLLQWRTIEQAKAAGARWFDLGGIDPEANPGVYHFKSGLGGNECSFVGEFVAPARGSGRVLLPLAERAYRFLGSRRRRGRDDSSEK